MIEEAEHTIIRYLFFFLAGISTRVAAGVENNPGDRVAVIVI